MEGTIALSLYSIICAVAQVLRSAALLTFNRISTTHHRVGVDVVNKAIIILLLYPQETC